MKSKNKIAKKIRRYSNLVNEIRNWPEYLQFKIFKSAPAFDFKLRNSFEIKVNRSMFSPFKEIFLDQVYLNEITKKHLRGGKLTIVDVGANVGFFSLFMLSKFPESRIYAFEPMPFNFRALENYRKQYLQFHWTVVNKAVSHSEQPLSLNASSIDSFTTMSSIVKNDKRTETIEVESITLEKIFDDYRLTSVDFLKLDCEGSEYAILYSSPEHILRKIHVMSIEAHPGQKEGQNLEALAAYLKNYGFELTAYKNGELGYIWAWRPG